MILDTEEFIESIVTAEVERWSYEMEAYLQRGLAAAQISLAKRLRLKLKETLQREASIFKDTDTFQKPPEHASPPGNRNETRESIPPEHSGLLEARADSATNGCDKPNQGVALEDLFSVVQSMTYSEIDSREKTALRSEGDLSVLKSDRDEVLPGTPKERFSKGAGSLEFSDAITTSGQDDPQLARTLTELHKIKGRPGFRSIARKVILTRFEGEEPREVTSLEKTLERNMGRRTISTIDEMTNKERNRRASVTSRAKEAASSFMQAVEKVTKADVAGFATSTMIAARSNFAPRGASFHHKHKSDSHWLLINPDSAFRRTWDTILFLTLIYCAFAMPYNISFVPESKSFPLLVLDYITDSVFMLDLVLNFITMIKDKHGNLITDPQEVAKKYVQTWFFVDLVATVPMETILKQSTLSFLKIGKIMRLAKLGRMFRIVKLLSLVNILRSMEHSVSHPSFIRLFKLFFLIAAVVHWFACMTHSVASQYDDVDDWLRSKSYHDHANSMKYLICVYWSSTTMLGEAKSPQEEAQVLVTMFVFYVGQVFYFTMFGSMMNVMSSMDAGESDFKTKVDRYQAYMRKLKMPLTLRNRVMEYMERLHNETKGVQSEEFMNELPSHLRQEMAMYLNRGILESTKVFEGCGIPFLTALLMRLSMSICLSGDVICVEGDLGNEMYIVVSGSVTVTKCGKKIGVLAQGSFFGEAVLTGQTTRSATIVAVESCLFYVITRAVFQPIAEAYPADYLMVKNFADRRLKSTLLVNGSDETAETDSDSMSEDST